LYLRIAAVSVAERIAQERAEEVGATVGYHIKLEKKASPHRTRCLLMTTGVLLRKIQLEGFVGVSHLFIDEGNDFLCRALSFFPFFY
jgi:HrpA-like RNA helicase